MTKEERRKREIEQRREAVINAANKLFYLKGYESVTMEEIAFEAEIGKTTLYKYFDDKESIFFVIVNHGIKIFKAMIENEIKCQKADGISTKVIRNASSQFLIKYPNYARAYLYFRSGKFDIFNGQCLNLDAKEAIEITKEMFDQATSEKEKRIENGTLRSDMNPFVRTAINILICEGASNGILNMDPFLREILESNGIDIQQFKTEAINLVQRLITSEEM